LTRGCQRFGDGITRVSNKARSGGGLTERRDDVIDDFLDQDAVVALAHHADHRLGAGGADQQPAMAVEALFAGDDRRFDLGVVERLAACYPNRPCDPSGPL